MVTHLCDRERGSRKKSQREEDVLIYTLRRKREKEKAYL